MSSNIIEKVKKLSDLAIKYSVLFKPQVKVNNVFKKDYQFPQKVIEKHFGECYFLREDRNYYLTDENTMRSIIKKDWMNYLKFLLFYIVDKFDCEDFSQYFKRFVAMKYKLNQVAVVYSYTSQHAFNLIVFPDESVRIFEPQTSQWWKPNEIPEHYKKFYVVSRQIIII